MFQHTVYMTHVQHGQHRATHFEIIQVQSILLNFIVILLYFGYNLAYIIYLGYGHMVHINTASDIKGALCEQCGPMPAGIYEGKFPLCISFKLYDFR